MKPLFFSLIFSFLLASTANISAQEAKTTPSVAPTNAKKAAKSTKKPKGLFKDDFDGDVGVKYIGTEPLPQEEIEKVKASTRIDEPAKPQKPTKPANKPAAKPVGQSTSEVGSTLIEEVKMTQKSVKTTEDATFSSKTSETKKTEKPVKVAEKAVEKPVKVAEKAVEKPVKVAEKAVEKPIKVAEKAVEKPIKVAEKAVEKPIKVAEKVVEKPIKVAAKSVEKPIIADEASKIKETKVEMTSAKTGAKPTAVEVTTPSKVAVEKAEITIPVVKSSTKAVVTKPITKASGRGARMEFEKMTIDLGNVKEDAVVERYFDFKNTGTSTLEILDCRGSCGCIQPRAMATIIEPGESGQIYVKYVARNKVGPQRPVVTLTTNGTPSVIRLFVETWVDQIPGGVKDPTPQPKSENN